MLDGGTGATIWNLTPPQFYGTRWGTTVDGGADNQDLDGILRAGRAYVFTAPGVIAVPIDPRTRDFVLEQNYPNPFNPRTTIAYSLARRSHVRLSIYDAAGRRITTLRSGLEDAGRHTVAWDAGQIASGTYFYELSVDGRAEIRKTTVIK